MTHKDNGDVLLKKVDGQQFDGHDIIPQENGDILCRFVIKAKVIDRKSALTYDYTKSTIKECYVSGNPVEKLKYFIILIEIYHVIGDSIKIIKKTKLNMDLTKKSTCGFHYMEDFGFSVQRPDANKCLAEILNQCAENGIRLNMKIKMSNGELIEIVVP